MVQAIKYIISILFLVIGYSGFAQPSWFFTNTANNHTILVQDTIEISIDGIQISAGDYIGVFYDSLGSEACAGFIQWQNMATTIAVWGTQPGLNDGFISGEIINWKIWRSADQQEFEATATYDTIMFPNQGNYTQNGLSRLASLTAIISGTSGPPWNYTITPITHQIIIPDSLIIAPNFSFSNGDYIGVFYTGIGTLKCGGYFEWSETTDTLVVFGNTPGDNNGFAQGEYISFILWKTTTNEQFAMYIQAIEFNLNSYPDSFSFVPNGLSFINSIGQFTGPDLQVNDIVYPESGCELAYQNIMPVIEITNVGDMAINEVFGVISFTNTYSDNFTISGLNILPNSTTLIEIPYQININTIGEYQFEINIFSQNDFNHTNSLIHKTITNSLFHNVSILTPDSVLCSNTQTSISLSGLPEGGIFTGQNIIGNEFYPSQGGIYPIIYEQLNPETGCSNFDTITITVLESPYLDFGNDMEVCNNDTIILSGPPDYLSYIWNGSSNTSNTLEVISSGIYSLTIIDSLGCQVNDEIEITFNPNPIVSISGYSAACEGDTIVLDAGDGFDFYQWQDSVTVFSQTFSATITDYYLVEVTMDNCSAVDSFFVNFFPLPEVEIYGPESACEGQSIKLEATIGYQYYFWSSGIGNSNYLDINQAGIYSVSVISSDNCIGSDEFEIAFYPYPEISFSNPPVLCIGDTFTLQPGIADSYLWQDGSNQESFQVISAGDYSVSMTLQGCTSFDEVSLLYFDSPVSSFNYDIDFNTVQFYNNSDIAENYTWHFGDAEISDLFEPEHFYNSAGIFEVILLSENFCGVSITTEFIEINNLNDDRSFHPPVFYPNPGRGNFKIDLPVLISGTFELSIFDNKGKMVIPDQEFNLERGEHILNINLEFVEDGIYHAIWKTNSNIFENTLVIINSKK